MAGSILSGMRLLLTLLTVSLAFAPLASAQPQTGLPTQPPGALSLGVLVGINTLQDPSEPLDEASDAANKKATSIVSDTKLPGGIKIHHVTQTERANPFQTLWIQISDGKVASRIVQDIIVPRRTGFWR